MPNHRHQRNHRHNEEDARNNNEQQPTAIAAPNAHEVAAGVNRVVAQPRQNDNAAGSLQKCCAPAACRFPDETIDPEDPYDAVKVVCNNEACREGTWMHKDCFEDFQQSVLAYLRSCGRARSWSEKQRLQNLWTKKGYDLAFKACDCRCGRGHLRKDLDYFPPPLNDNSKKHKRHKKKNDKPMPVVSTTHKSNSHSSHPGNNNHGQNAHHLSEQSSQPPQQSGVQQNVGVQQNGRKNSVSSIPKMETTTKYDFHTVDNHQTTILDNHMATTTSIATTNSGNITSNNGNPPIGLPVHGNPRLRTNSVSSTGSVGSHASSSCSLPSSGGSGSPISSSPISGDMFFKGRKSSDTSTDNGSNLPVSFRQRQDLSAFASLPRTKQNPYNIRMEETASLAFALANCSMNGVKSGWELGDAGGCDTETRNFVLTNLLSKRMTSCRCALCKRHLPVFDRFPLLDGTFFLSPQSYDETAIQVIWDGRIQFLNAACLACLEGRTEVRCVACKRLWDGRSLVVGSMYTYDIFAAMPCCQKRLTCKCCRRAVVDVTRGLNFFSQYSHMIICPYCKANDYHFIRSLPETFFVSDRGTGLSVGPICE